MPEFTVFDLFWYYCDLLVRTPHIALSGTGLKASDASGIYHENRARLEISHQLCYLELRDDYEEQLLLY